MTAPININDLLSDAEEGLRRMASQFRNITRFSQAIERELLDDEATAIMKFVASFYGVSVRDLKSKQRPNRITTPRHVAMAVIRENCPNLSLSEIGRMFGGRDHGTVLHACENVNNWKYSDKKFAAELAYIREKASLNHADALIDGAGI